MAMFAGYTALISQHDDLNAALQQLQRMINKLSIWLNKWVISLNYDKCVSKTFALRRIKNPPYLQISRKIITRCFATVGYLGVRQDTKLKWSPHINSKLNEGYAILTQLYPLINKRTLRTEYVSSYTLTP